MPAPVGKSSVQIFDDIAYDSEVKASKYEDYFPTSIISDNSPIEFVIPAQKIYYTDLQSFYLTIVAKVVKGDGKNLDYDQAKEEDRSKVGPVNNFGSSIFKQVEVLINNTPVTQVS